MLTMPFVRSAYNYDRNEAGDESGLKCEDVSLAKQSEAADADINTIVRRFGVGVVAPENVRPPVYGDFTGIGSFHEAVNAIAAANESFDAMPADVRARFGNDTGQFVDFCSDPANLDEMKKYGLLVPEEPVKVASGGNGPTVSGSNDNGNVAGSTGPSGPGGTSVGAQGARDAA